MSFLIYHLPHVAFYISKHHQFIYFTTTRTNSSEQEMHEKHELKQLQQPNENEGYEYSHEKVEHVSLPHKNASIQPYTTAKKTKQTERKNNQCSKNNT